MRPPVIALFFKLTCLFRNCADAPARSTRRHGGKAWVTGPVFVLLVILMSAVSAVHAQTIQPVKKLADIPYGPDLRQRMDVYLPATPVGAPALVMVHGGAWMIGNKAMPNVTVNKIDLWVRQKGWILVSVGYRLSPQADPLVQAADVAAALAKAQSMAEGWGGDPAKFVLMGHSAGAHLVGLISTSQTLARDAGVRPWLGSVLLDSAALDVERIMQARHPGFYDRVFGADPAFWQAASPTRLLTTPGVPMLLVCSSSRADGSCAQSNAFASVAREKGRQAPVLEQALSHEQINAELGLPGPYTDAIFGFMQSLPGLR